MRLVFQLTSSAVCPSSLVGLVALSALHNRETAMQAATGHRLSCTVQHPAI